MHGVVARRGIACRVVGNAPDHGLLLHWVLAAAQRDEGGRALERGLAAYARTDERLAHLASEPRCVGDDGVEVDVGGELVERSAKRHQRARVAGDAGVLRVVEDGPRVRQLAPDLEERREFDGGGLADGAAEQRPLGRRVETVAALHDV